MRQRIGRFSQDMHPINTDDPIDWHRLSGFFAAGNPGPSHRLPQYFSWTHNLAPGDAAIRANGLRVLLREAARYASNSA
jgi:hypothetical protein